MDMHFFENKKILITGHTGFKGSWMCKLLLNVGANVTGYGLEPSTNLSLFYLCDLSTKMNSIIGDIRDLEHLKQVFKEVNPEIVIHMAAQPLVRESYQKPVYTYEVNVMGTVNILECVRTTESVKSFLNVTTDKVYLNREWEWGYRENEELNGFDPYSNSKSCSELVTRSYVNSFFEEINKGERTVAVSTARAGNVIGGGDFAVDRIIPDCIRAVCMQEKIILRNPYSTRPYQHVLEPICAYMMILKAQYNDVSLAGSYNIGPDEEDCLTTGELTDLFCKKWNKKTEQNVKWESQSNDGPHEANYLKLDCSKLKKLLHWSPRWNIDETMNKIVEWVDIYRKGEDINCCMDKQIMDFLNEEKS